MVKSLLWFTRTEKPRNASQPAEMASHENLQSLWPFQHLGVDLGVSLLIFKKD